METWHTRLQQALTARQLDWPDLVIATGLKKPSVYAWKPSATKRVTMMAGDNAAVVCDYLRINALWLFLKEGPSGLETALGVQEPRLAYSAATPTKRDKLETIRSELSEEGVYIGHWYDKVGPEEQYKVRHQLIAANLALAPEKMGEFVNFFRK